MTVQYLFIYNTVSGNQLAFNEVLAFKEVNIGYFDNPLDITVTVTLSPGALDGMTGDNLWFNELALISGTTNGDSMLATTTGGAAASNYIKLVFSSTNSAIDHVMIGAVLVIG